MAKSTPKAAIGYKYGRLVEQSGGMVDAVVHPALLKDSEARLLKNVSIREKGTVKTTEGRKARFDTPFDAFNPCNGLTAFYPDTTTSRLVMGAGSKLYSDTPHLIQQWDSENDWGQWDSNGIDKSGGTLKIAKEYGIQSVGTLTEVNSGTTEYELGWMFTVGGKSIMVTGLRIYAAKTASVSAKLWRVSDQTKLKEINISAVANSWVEAVFDSVSLDPGAAYIVSVNVPKDTEYKQISKTANTYNDLITCNEGRYITTQGQFPTTANTDIIYGLIDLLVYAKGSSSEVIHTTKADWDAQSISNLSTSIAPGDVVLQKTGPDLNQSDALQAGTLENVWVAEEGLQLDTTTVRTWNDFTGANWEVLA